MVEMRYMFKTLKNPWTNVEINNLKINQNNSKDIQETVNNLKKYNLGLYESKFLVKKSYDM